MRDSDSCHVHKRDGGDVRIGTDILLIILLLDNSSGFLFINTPENHS